MMCIIQKELIFLSQLCLQIIISAWNIYSGSKEPESNMI